jgi:glycine C-acetyltransferase
MTPMTEAVKKDLEARIMEIRSSGLYKEERVIGSPQGARIRVGGQELLNLCANNYLGLASDPKVIEEARRALERWGYGMASVRFICGTLEVHRELEHALSEFLGTEDTILYSSCFDANGGLFEPILGEDCALVTDRLNHASIIDGARLCRAKRIIYEHSDMMDLEVKLKEVSGMRITLIMTDGVFSMDGDMAKLPDICALGEKYGALVAVDDSHATGFIGGNGRGTAEHFGVMGRLDGITTTFGKALGGATGGCFSGRKEIVELLRQKSRPYLFSNTLAPMVAAVTLSIVRGLGKSEGLRERLHENTRFFRRALTDAGFDVKPGEHPIMPLMLYEERLAVEMADRLLGEGIYVVGFSYPVVPKGQARIRVQMSAALSLEDLANAAESFTKVGKALGIIR